MDANEGVAVSAVGLVAIAGLGVDADVETDASAVGLEAIA